MGADSKIQWTDSTFNPWWGCARVSPGCEHCYAEMFAKRFGVQWGAKEERRFFGDKHWAEPLKWNTAAAHRGERHRVFCASMADVFEDRADLAAPRARLHALIRDTPHLDWLLLTKRPENADRLWRTAHVDAFNGADSLGLAWTPNIWLGTTVEDQQRADERVPHLLRVPAAVRFLSVEPMLAPVDLRAVKWPDTGEHRVDVLRFGYWRIPDRIGVDGFVNHGDMHADFGKPIDWVIVGGESGHGARPFALAWARGLVEQCKAAGTAVFVKQLGGAAFDDISGIVGAALRVDAEAAPLISRRLVDKKGGDIAEFPPELRVREFPPVAR